MTQNSKFIVPALVALSMFAFAPAHADGPDKNGGGEVDKNGSGEVDKNGPDTSKYVGQGETDKNTGQPPAARPPGGDGETDKNTGEPPAPPTPPSGGGKNGGGGGGHHSGNGSGGSYNENSGLITCVVNGRVFKVRDIRKCYVQPSYGDYQVSPPVYHAQKKHRRVAVSGGMNYGGCGCAYGYSYGQQPVIRYYKPASRAAVMQQQKRARREAAYGYSNDGGYGYDAGYSMQSGYGYESGYVVTLKKHRRARAQTPIYMPSYDQGYVVHYGPTISKDGGY